MKDPLTPAMSRRKFPKISTDMLLSIKRGKSLSKRFSQREEEGELSKRGHM